MRHVLQTKFKLILLFVFFCTKIIYSDNYLAPESSFRSVYHQWNSFDISEIERVREDFSKQLNESMLILKKLFPEHEITGRLKETDRILDKIFRNTTEITKITDIAGVTIVTSGLDEVVQVFEKLLKIEELSGDFKVYDYINGKDIQPFLTRVKRRSRTWAIILEKNGMPIEVGIQTRLQKLWTSVVHETPFYKKNRLTSWDLTELQIEEMEKYALSVSFYFHSLELRNSSLLYEKSLYPIFMLPELPAWFKKRINNIQGVTSTDRMDDFALQLFNITHIATFFKYNINKRHIFFASA